MIRTVYKSYYYMMVNGLSVINIEDWLDISDTGKYFGLLWSLIEPIYKGFVVFGLIFCVIWFYTDMIDKASRQEFTLIVFAKQCMMLVCALSVVSLGIPLIQGIAEMGTGLMETTTATTIDQSILDDIYKQIDDAGTLDLIGGLVGITLFYAVMQACSIAAIVASATRSLNFFVYACLFPLGVSDIYRNGPGSSGMRYVKKLCSLALQGAAIELILKISMQIRASVTMANLQLQGIDAAVGIGGGGLEVIGLTIATIGAIFGAIKICDDVMGV